MAALNETAAGKEAETLTDTSHKKKRRHYCILFFDTLAEVNAVKIRYLLVQERSELLEDTLRYPQAKWKAETQIDQLAKVTKESIFNAFAYTLVNK